MKYAKGIYQIIAIFLNIIVDPLDLELLKLSLP